jgi:uncharacterized protein (UPF0332 family)
MSADRKKIIAKYRLERAKECFAVCEACIDTSLYGASNRLYYAIFNAIRSVLALEGVDFKKHSAVISHFRQHYLKPGVFDQTYSVLIGDAEKVRLGSDYDDLYVPDRGKIIDLMEEARTFLALIEQYVSQT